MSTDEPTYATMSALAGLAAELDGLRKRVEPLHKVPGRLEQLADRVELLADELGAFLERAGPAAIPSWLAAPADPEQARAVLGELVAWLDAVWLRYPDGAAALPECWLWHPHVIEELLWCQHAWLAAYQGRGACVALVADWHDRHRPGVAHRIKQAAGQCSLERHTNPTPPGAAPLTEAADQLADWWATARTQPPPVPTAEQRASAESRRRTAAARR